MLAPLSKIVIRDCYTAQYVKLVDLLAMTACSLKWNV